jgi:hypothetical protein
LARTLRVPRQTMRLSEGTMKRPCDAAGFEGRQGAKSWQG